MSTFERVEILDSAPCAAARKNLQTGRADFVFVWCAAVARLRPADSRRSRDPHKRGNRDSPSGGHDTESLETAAGFEQAEPVSESTTPREKSREGHFLGCRTRS